MKKVNIHCEWDLEFDLFHEKQLEIWVDSFPGTNKDNGSVHIGVLVEPRELTGITNIGFYDYTLTHDPLILSNSGKSFLYEFGGCWAKDYEQSKDKIFGVSTLVGNKKWLPGHILRTSLVENKNRIKVPNTIWASKNLPPHNSTNCDKILFGSKSEMFDKQFHICIENIKRENWFTEKLIDCLYTRTIPIYYGCPNIGNWFDTKGFIIVDSVNAIINKTNSITKETYQEMLPYIEKNHERSKKYINVGENVKRSIEKNIIPLL